MALQKIILELGNISLPFVRETYMHPHRKLWVVAKSISWKLSEKALEDRFGDNPEKFGRMYAYGMCTM